MPPVLPTIANDAAERGAAGVVDSLPWPLSAIGRALLGDRLAAVKAATTPNSYSAAPGASQQAIAMSQGRRAALRGGFSGLAGTSTTWDTDQSFSGPVAGSLVQDVSSAEVAPSRLIPWQDQRPRDGNTTRGYTGPVITPGSTLKWGWSTRFSFPRIISGTLLPPEARTPTPREMASAYVAANPNGLRVDDPYLVPDDSEEF